MKYISKKYAEIIFAKIKNSDNVDLLVDVICEFSEKYSSDKLLKNFLNSPIVKYEEKSAFFDGIFDDFKNIKNIDIIANFFKILILDNFIDSIDEISRHVSSLSLIKKGFTQVKLKFPYHPNSDEIEKIKKLFDENFKIKSHLQFEIDESLISGYIADFNGKRLDMSLKKIINMIG